MSAPLNPRRRRLLASFLIAGSTFIFAGLVVGGSSWLDLFVATFDGVTNDPGTWADVGTVTTTPTTWQKRTTGDSGPKPSGKLLITSDGGDPTANVGINCITQPVANGVLVATFEFEPKQRDAIFKATLGIDRGADIIGLTFDGDGLIKVAGRPEQFAYAEDRVYRVWLVLTWIAPTVARADFMVSDKSNAVTIANWTFMVDQAVPSVSRLTLLRQGGPVGSFELDNIDIAWLSPTSGH